MWEMLSPDEIQFLAGLPLSASLRLGGERVALVHATPSDPLFRYMPANAGAAGWAEEVARVDVEFLLTGHTHLPLALRVGGALVVNPGSVGEPKDGDPRAAYAVIEDGRVEHRRVAYEIARTVAGLDRLGLPQDVHDQLVRVLRSGMGAQDARALWESGRGSRTL